jgi:hypothetical protein
MRRARNLALIAGIAALCIAGAACAADSGRFEQLPDGCQAWVSSDAYVVQHWTGGCRDGKAEGRGVLTGQYRTRDGQSHAWRFEGRMVAGLRTGFGHNAIEGVGDFDGQYRRGLANGWGRFRFAQGGSWEGQYRDGVGNGIGTQVGANGTRVRARWVDDEITGVRQRSAADGSWWAAFDLAPDGTARGILQGTAGEYQAGQYRLVDDKFLREGTALYFWKDQKKMYFGHFERNLPNGQGVFVGPDKKNPDDAAAYPGTWKDGCNWRDVWYTNVIVDKDDCRR